MTKNGLIIPFCFIVASGCSIFDKSETTTETPSVAVTVTENEQQAMEAQPAPAKEAAIAPRSLSNNDVRRLQLRLQELGFNPGPADGVVGSRTKTAFGRLEMGCAKLEPLSENLPASMVQGLNNPTKNDKVPSRADILNLQGQLRSAGFDPGPADGILGKKTRSLISILHSSCAMAKEFHGTLDKPVTMQSMETRVAPQAETAKASNPSASGEAATPASAGQTASQEEIRVLQLRLRDAGFDPGPFDGVMGAKTKAALEQYEASQRNKKTNVSLPATKISDQY
jgi:peptidoglycan hydrolase-like protein with peptidoglycan-binding domain